MTENPISIRLATAADVDAVVKVHLASFQGFFLTFLGRQFLNELYAGIIADPTGIAFVYGKENRILGFVAGTDQPSGFYRRLLRQCWCRFAWASIGPVLRNPRIIPQLFRAFSRGEQTDVRENCATLMSIAVDPNVQGQGVGRLLVEAFLSEAKQRCVNQVNLTTDKLDNEAVNAFYLNLGFRLYSSFVTAEGREMNEYIIDL